ncbi:hypothetical protein PHO31112_04305 [Pandoraea horticolens]|uniref:Mobilization protein MobC n=1 Tax=Pandoraea horticolens TaxID=2508298 RepID=A0A5E4Y6R9_9BURK|nr:hypothetical protein [Pandoraea horticolens]VVE44042.1 hypothetical protein PHO31112_04305 [Pandoraea horticolens]
MARKRTVSLDIIEKAKIGLTRLPQKSVPEKSIDAALEEIKPQIQSLLKKGYSRADVCEHLLQLGIQTKEYQLKALLSRKRFHTKER